MKDDVWKRDEVQSPCVKNCVVLPSARICIGCLRTLDEISQWSKMSPEARSQIIAELPSRSQPENKRRGGRAARLQRRAS